VLFGPGDRVELAARLVELFRDPTRRGVLGVNGRKWVSEKYRWTVDEAVFLKAIGGLAPGQVGSEARPDRRREAGSLV
jgi:hypothetical protein